jgi:hypothetical protein
VPNQTSLTSGENSEMFVQQWTQAELSSTNDQGMELFLRS